jgi:ribosomal-protein-alanine N-acetyltransferase
MTRARRRACQRRPHPPGYATIPLAVTNGELIVLRPLLQRDAGALHRLYADRRVAEPCRIQAPATPQEAGRLLDTWSERERAMDMRRWALALHRGPLVGMCGLKNISRDSDPSAYLTYALSPAHWGRGLMRRALTHVLRTAFESMQLHRICAEVETTNERSSGLLARLGFSFVGEFPADSKRAFELRRAPISPMGPLPTPAHAPGNSGLEVRNFARPPKAPHPPNLLISGAGCAGPTPSLTRPATGVL